MIKFVERKKSLQELETSIKANKSKWLNNLYSLIIKIKGHFPLDIKICLTQRGEFRIAAGICWDKCNDEAKQKLCECKELTKQFVEAMKAKGCKDFRVGRDLGIPQSVGNIELYCKDFKE